MQAAVYISSLTINTVDTSSSHLSDQSRALMGQPSTSSATSDSDSDFDPDEALKNDPDACCIRSVSFFCLYFTCFEL